VCNTVTRGIEVVGHWRDHSSDNTIYGNRFYDGSTLDIQDEPNLLLSNRFNGSVLEIGASAPIGDDPIYFSGRIARNTFDHDSWIGGQGSASLAFHDLDVVDNTDEFGACYAEYRLRVRCVTQTSVSCYGKARDIDGAVCTSE
jgi:hypothetical protein